MATAAMYRVPPGRTPDPVVLTALAGWSDERLQALLVARPDLAYPAPADFASLAVRAATGPGVAACRHRLDQWCLQVGDAVCLLGDPGTVGDLRGLLALPVDDADLDAALARLEDLALVFRSGHSLHAVEGLRALPYPAGLGPPVADLFGRRAVPEVREMLSRLGMDTRSARPALLAELARALCEPDVALGIVAAGPRGTTELADDLRRYGAVSLSSGTGWMPDHTPAGWLANRGLVGATSYTTVVLTREAGLGLRGGRPYAELVPRPPELTTVPVDQAAADAGAAEAALGLVADVAAVLDGFAETPPRILKSGGVGIRDVRGVAKALGRSDEATARLIELAAVAGLAVADPASGTALPRPAYDDWLGLDAARRWAALAVGWLGADVHVSVAGAADGKGKPVPPLLDRGPDRGAASQRRLLLAALAGLEPGAGVDPADLSRRVLWAAPVQWIGSSVPPSALVSWISAEADALGVSTHGTLSTHGRLLVSGDIAGAVLALAAFAPDPVDQVVIQADLSAMAAGELAPPLRAEFELLADVESTGAATVYRFSEASLRRGFAAGRTAEEITSFLEAHASRGVPQPLVYLVADLGRRYGQVRVGQARAYVRSDDPSLLAEVRRGRRTAALGFRELAPTVMVADAAPAEVLAALVAAGYLAAEEDGAGTMILTGPARRRAAPPAHRGGYGRGDDLAELAGVLADLGSADTGVLASSGGHVAGASLPAIADPAATVAALRRAPLTPTPRAPERRPPWIPGLFALDDADEDDDDDDISHDAVRPIDIARHPVTIAVVLDAADENEWPVRLAHVERGREVQVTAFVLAVDDGHVLLECLPKWKDKAVSVADIRWARVLTETEESFL